MEELTVNITVATVLGLAVEVKERALQRIAADATE